MLNIDQVNKFTKDEKNGLFCDKTVHFLYVNLKNRRITNYIVDKSYYFK